MIETVHQTMPALPAFSSLHLKIYPSQTVQLIMLKFLNKWMSVIEERLMFKKYLIVFLISMVPLVELRGAVPYAIAMGLPVLPSYIIAIIGNMIPVPFIFFFARKVLEWGKDKPVIGKFFTFCLEKGHKGGEALKQKAGKGLYWALFLFVGIPVPGTGAWTGTLAASILDMDFKKSVRAIICGVVLAGVIMGLGTKIIMLIAGLF